MMPTRLSYAVDKFTSAAIRLGNSADGRSMRAVLHEAYAGDLRHAGPPFGDEIPAPIADRAADLLVSLATMSDLSDDELKVLAAEVVLLADAFYALHYR